MKRNAEENLAAGAKTFAQRHKAYGDSYVRFGHVMAGLFPKGLRIEPGDVDGFNRLGVFVQVVSKATRYAESLEQGGHEDSAHDTMVYGAILEELTKGDSHLNHMTTGWKREK